MAKKRHLSHYGMRDPSVITLRLFISRDSKRGDGNILTTVTSQKSAHCKICD